MMARFYLQFLKKNIMATSTKTKKAASPKAAHKAPTNTEPALMELFVDEIKDIYWAEKHLVKTLPKLQKAASSEDLKKAFGDHLEVTKEHVTRLEKVFELLGQKPQAKKCEAMEGITKEGESIIEDTEDGTATRDVGLIMAGQKVEHYEIATYGALARVAKTLGHAEVVRILQSPLAEEKQA